MLFFVDESWQTVGGTDVGALGAVAIPIVNYNRFCSGLFRIKRDILGAGELTDSEIKGTHLFSKASFKHHGLYGDSHWIPVADRLFDLLRSVDARTFVIWTSSPELLDLRSSNSTALSKPYKQLLYDFRALMRAQGVDRLGHLNFDERHYQHDVRAACAIQNFLVRTQGDWRRHFVQIPNFTVSVASPGVQAADVVAHLGCHFADQTARPELLVYLQQLTSLRWQYRRGRHLAKTIRRVM